MIRVLRIGFLQNTLGERIPIKNIIFAGILLISIKTG